MGIGAGQDVNNLALNSYDAPLPKYEEKAISGVKNAIRGTRGFPSMKRASRNSQFYGLSVEERAELGGVEYRAVSFLSILVPVYFFSFVIIGVVGMGCWMVVNRPSIARDNGLHPFFTGAFFAVSAFVNSGMALLDANMTALQTESVLSVTLAFMMNLAKHSSLAHIHF